MGLEIILLQLTSKRKLQSDVKRFSVLYTPERDVDFVEL